MQTLLKTLLALSLGLGFLALDARAQDPAAAAAAAPAKKPTVAFLGLTEGSDPQVCDAITKRIRRELGADSALTSVSSEQVEMLYAKGVLRAPDARPEDPGAVSKALKAEYFAYGTLERIAVTSKRTWWKPWSTKVAWKQGMRLHVIDGTKGVVAFDGLVDAIMPETNWLDPEEDWGMIPPLEREGRLRAMAEAISVESAKSLAKTVKDKAAAAGTPPSAAPASPG